MDMIRRTLPAFVVASAFAALAVTRAEAGIALTTENGYSGNSIWITIYDLGKLRHLDWGCVRSTRDWRSGNYAYGSFYYVRGEAKNTLDCSGPTVCDTTIQANPQYQPSRMQSYGTGFRMRYNVATKGCYWEPTNRKDDPGMLSNPNSPQLDGKNRPGEVKPNLKPGG